MEPPSGEGCHYGGRETYCFLAIELNTKMVFNFALGKLNQVTTDAFIEGVGDAITPGQRFQITTDGFRPYLGPLSLHLAYYCFFRVRKSLRVTPAMEAGIAKYVWTMADCWRENAVMLSGKLRAFEHFSDKMFNRFSKLTWC